MGKGEANSSGMKEVYEDGIEQRKRHDKFSNNGGGGIGIGGNGKQQNTTTNNTEESEVKDSAKIIIKKAPRKPSKAEMDEHMASGHVNYRNWCKHAAHCQAVNDPHRQVHKEGDFPTIVMYYTFFGESVKERRERKDKERKGGPALEDRGVPIIAIGDNTSKFKAADIVPKKAEDSFAIKRVAQIIQSLGYGEIIIKFYEGLDICYVKQYPRSAVISA